MNSLQCNSQSRDPFERLNPNLSCEESHRQLFDIMSLIIPSEQPVALKGGRRVYGPQDCFYSTARLICVFLALKELHQGRQPSKATLREGLAGNLERLQRWLCDAEQSTLGTEQYQQAGAFLHELLVKAPKDFLCGLTLAEFAVRN